MELTENFTLEEMLRSTRAKVEGFTEQFSPSEQVQHNLSELCGHILQPLRDGIGKPVNVTSGYRCRRLNGVVGGSKTSQHEKGEAADINVPGLTIDQVIAKIIELDLPFDQLIHEFGIWVHVSFSSRNRRQVLMAVKTSKKKTVYYKYVPGRM